MYQTELCFIDSCWLRYSNYKYIHRWKYDKGLAILISFCGTVKRTGELKDFLLHEDQSCPKCKLCLKAKEELVID